MLVGWGQGAGRRSHAPAPVCEQLTKLTRRVDSRLRTAASPANVASNATHSVFTRSHASQLVTRTGIHMYSVRE